MIYFIRCTETNAIKIGYAENPQQRFSKIQSDSPGHLELLAVEDGAVAREAELHRQFLPLRRRGEWFDYAGPLTRYVASLEPFVKTRRQKPLGGKLGAWLHSHNTTATEFAASVDATTATISRICSGECFPRPDLMVRIAHRTNGAVMPNDYFHDLPEVVLAA